jgi:hypothetical protein
MLKETIETRVHTTKDGTLNLSIQVGPPQAQQMILLTNRDRDLFLAALEEADVRPNRSLRKAGNRFKRSYQ